MKRISSSSPSKKNQKPTLSSRGGDQSYSRTKALDIIDWQSAQVNHIQNRINDLTKGELYDQLSDLNALSREKQINYATELLKTSQYKRETYKKIDSSINHLEDTLDRALHLSNKKLERRNRKRDNKKSPTTNQFNSTSREQAVTSSSGQKLNFAQNNSSTNVFISVLQQLGISNAETLIQNGDITNIV